jgi:YkoY family integral membrane protein
MLNVFPIILTLLSVAVVDSLLSVDNALVLAVVVEHLPRAQRKNALRYGILGAYAMRGASILFASLLINLTPLKVAGGVYLLWLALSHLYASARGTETNATGPSARGFWMTVVTVEWLDFMFSLDNILATVALSKDTLVVILGVFVSILAMRFVAGLFLRWLEVFPILRTTAYLLVLFVGGKLLASVWGFEIGEIETFIGLASILVGSLIWEQFMLVRSKRLAAQQGRQVKLLASKSLREEGPKYVHTR